MLQLRLRTADRIGGMVVDGLVKIAEMISELVAKLTAMADFYSDDPEHRSTVNGALATAERALEEVRAHLKKSSSPE